MPYSARKLHCLESMGLVPWISAALEPENTPENTAENNSSAGTGPAAPPPRAASELGNWLMSRPLAACPVQGTRQTVIGSASAPLLVFVEVATEVADTLPLSGEAQQLFDLMLRSIKLSSRDTRLCALASAAATGSTEKLAGSVCNAHTRAVLVLLDSWGSDETESGAELHMGRLPCRVDDTDGDISTLQLPLWRIAHPRRLLEQPQLKRQAWQVLKSVQSELAGHTQV